LFVAYRGDVDGDDVGLAALVEEPDGQLARRPALLLHADRQVAVRVLARDPVPTKNSDQMLILLPYGQKKKKKNSAVLCILGTCERS